MPTFDDTATTEAPVEEVWKLMYDPARMPDWWEGVATVAPEGHEGKGDVTMYVDGYPDFPMPQDLRTDANGRSVTLSCLVSELVFAWQLEPDTSAPGGDGTCISVHVDIPEAEAHRLDAQRAAVSASLRNLAVLASATPGPPARG